jgi:HEAT repeat protein
MDKEETQNEDAPDEVDAIRHWSVPLSMALVAALAILAAVISVARTDPSQPVLVMTQQQRIDSFTEDLYHEHDSSRKQGAAMLADMGGAGVDALVEAMHSDEDDVRRAAASGLTVAGDEGIAAATKTLRSDDPNAAAWAAWALGQICEQESAEPLAGAAIHWLEHYDPNAERVEFTETWRRGYNPTERPVTYAAHAMGVIGNPKSAGTLRTIAAGPAEDAAAAAREAISKLRTPGEPVPPAPGQIETASVDDLVAALKSNHSDVRIAACDRLQELEDPTVCDKVRPLLHAEGPSTQYRAVLVLGHHGDTQALDRILQLASDESASSRHRMLRALGSFDDPRVVPVLVRELGHEHTGTRHAALKALMEVGDESAVPDLIDCLDDEEAYMRQDAAIALGNIGDARAVDPLIEATRDEHEYTAMRAGEALGRIGDPRAIDRLAEMTRAEDWNQSSAAIEALGSIGGERAVEALEQAIIDRPRQRHRIDEALEVAHGAEEGQNGG